jgi:hypothetical protein
MNFDTIQVECYSGYKVNERPLAFTWRGKTWKVKEIADRWYEGGLSANDPSLDRGRTRKPRLVGGVKGPNIIKLFLTGKPRPVGGELHYFKVITDEGEEFILRYNSLFDAWSIAVNVGEGTRG